MQVDAWEEIFINTPTGLAAVGSPIRVRVPDDLPGKILVGDAAVVAPGRIRLRFCNNGLHRSPAREFTVQLLPYERRRSLLPEIKFDLPEGI